MKEFLLICSAAPLFLANMANTANHASDGTSKLVDCECKVPPPVAAKSLIGTNDVVDGKGMVPLAPLCHDVEILEEYCTLQSTTMQTWCASGGIFRTCEDATGDNDNDHVYGEPHFMQKRYIVTYTCTTGTKIVCGDWIPMKLGGGTGGQDVCCMTTTAPPACPTGSLPPCPPN